MINNLLIKFDKYIDYILISFIILIIILSFILDINLYSYFLKGI